MIKIVIRPMTKNDIVPVANVHSKAFVRQQASNKWISCNFRAYPRILMYVAVNEDKQVVGYIQWLQKSGFRKEAVIELEQIAVLPVFQGNKIGIELTNQSLQSMKNYLMSQNAILKAIIVTTRADNAAQKLYEKCLGVHVTATIKNLYSADEVIMVANFT